MFATECSNPSTTKETTGRIVAASLSHTVLPALPIQTPRHTRTLHRTPRAKAVTGSSEALESATA